jgi:ComF family protein
MMKAGFCMSGISSGFSRWWEDLLNLVFPRRQLCLLCGAASAEEDICRCCRQMIAEKKIAGWPECAGQDCYFILARSAGHYDGILKQAIWRFKFGGQRYLARPLGNLMAEVVDDLATLCRLEETCRRVEIAGLVPVPLARGRLRKRGFNQSELLARQVSLTLGLPLLPVLHKVRETPPQTGLSREQRQSNLKDAFGVCCSVLPVGRSVILIDDVFTTGCTASECARVLLTAGIGRVYVVTLASVAGKGG